MGELACAGKVAPFLLIQTSGRNRDFELKNGSGFWGRGFIAGGRFEPTTLLSKSLDNTAFFFLCIHQFIVFCATNAAWCAQKATGRTSSRGEDRRSGVHNGLKKFFSAFKMC